MAVFDGRGNEAMATVHRVGRRMVSVRPTEKREPAPEPSVAIALGQALLKHDKMDRVIRDAVMLGVAEIRPFTSARTEIPNAAIRQGGRQSRWDRTVLASVKQCGRAVVPPVQPVVNFETVLGGLADVTIMFVEPGAVEPEPCALTQLETHVPAKAMILVGPEGGWDPSELRAAQAAGVTMVRLGSRVLRADAAGPLAMVALQTVWKDL